MWIAEKRYAGQPAVVAATLDAPKATTKRTTDTTTSRTGRAIGHLINEGRPLVVRGRPSGAYT
jgi:hypothetical protein